MSQYEASCLPYHIVPGASWTSSTEQDLAKLLNLGTQTSPNITQDVASSFSSNPLPGASWIISIEQNLAELPNLDH